MNKEELFKIKKEIHELNVEISKLSANICANEEVTYEEAKATITSRIFYFIFTKINPKEAKSTNHADALYAKI